MRIGVYPGSFDPITYGHIDIIKRSSALFDKLYLLISINKQKTGLLTYEERKELLELAIADYDNVEVRICQQLSVKEAVSLGATHIIRGLRAVTDFDYEFQLTSANRILEPSIDTVFMMTDIKYSFLSSTTVKEIAKFDGDLTSFVPKYVEIALKEKLKNN